VCLTSIGSVVEEGLLLRLADMQVIDQRPEESPVDHDSWLARLQYYHQIWLPILRIMVATLTSLREGEGVVKEALVFVQRHTQLLSTILKNRCTILTVDSLHELRLVTAFFHRISIFPKEIDGALKSKAAKFNTLLQRLLAKYTVESHYMSVVQPVTDLERVQEETQFPALLGPFRQATRFRYEVKVVALEILFNVTAYCRNRITRQSRREPDTLRLFGPSTGGRIASNVPTVDILGYLKRDCLPQLHAARTVAAQIRGTQIHKLGPEQVKEVYQRDRESVCE
jgi:hypothetical protein